MKLKKFLSTFNRLLASTLVGCGVSGTLIAYNYDSYWNQTIYKVQTVDFNMLGHSLPTKLSSALISNNDEELQKTLDSNYTLFGLVVTDAEGKNIIAASGDRDRSYSWSDVLSDPTQLEGHPYDLLMDPPPQYTQAAYESPGATERTESGISNPGRTIGRLYYVRGVPPSFRSDVLGFLKEPFKPSGRYEIYRLAALAGLTSTLTLWILLEFFTYRRRAQTRRHEDRERQLLEQQSVLEAQLKERLSNIESQQSDKVQEQEESRQLAQSLKSQNELYQRQIQQLQNLLKQTEAKVGQYDLVAEIEDYKREQAQYQEQERQKDQALTDLNRQIEAYQRQLQEATATNANELEQQLRDALSARDATQGDLKLLRGKEQQARSDIQGLSGKLSETERLNQDLKDQLRAMQEAYEQSQQQAQLAESRAKGASKQIEQMAKEKELLQEELNPKHPLNRFEQEALSLLNRELNQSIVLTQFDTAKRGVSRFTDFLISMENCIVVIEAKSYPGYICSENPRNSPWYCKTDSGKLLINSCHGPNPYHQAKACCDAFMGYSPLMKDKSKRVPIYGIVLFPKHT